MPWNWVIGQQRVVDALECAVAADRVAHGYLFHGPDGVGKRAVALALAQALQCDRRPSGKGDACGECGPCQKVARMIHPDVRFYFAQPSDADEGDVAARLGRLARDPYAETSFSRRPDLSDPGRASNKHVLYTVDRMRDEITRELQFTPAEGRFKVAVLTDAASMNPQAANAFLKTLEEPTPRTVLILTAARADTLLPTIASRCQRLRFDRLPAELIENALIERARVDPGLAPATARMADGSYTNALVLLESDELTERRQQVLTFFRLAFGGHLGPLDDLVQDLSKLRREPLKGTLALMLTWVRDLLLAQTLGPDAPLVNLDQADSVFRFVEKVPGADLEAMACQIEHAIELIERNVNTTLTLTVLADALRDAMHGRPRERLFTALADPAAA
jgi:DNA polymerase III subunit delta'